jgi:hypothetical protein
MRIKPSYSHDCGNCRFVAGVFITGRIVDIYKSCNSPSDGYIIRFSDEGPDYSTTFAPGQEEGVSKYFTTYGKQTLLALDHFICEQIDQLVNRETA